MKTVRAQFAGACFGVQRALDLALAQTGKGVPVQTLGPLIHNPQVVSDLEGRGVRVVDGIHDGLMGTVVVRSHGVGPAVRRELEESGLDVVDATCPHVLRAQRAAENLARELGYVLVVGDPDHPEVDAIREYAQAAGGRVQVVPDAGSLPADLPKRVGVVVQTTQNRRVFEEVVAELRRREVDPDVRDTICSATSKRQEAAANLAGEVDAMVVIGGHNSSNTTRLYEICKALLPKTYHIETLEELDPGDFEGCTAVGITAGASTPEEQIEHVQHYLEGL